MFNTEGIKKEKAAEKAAKEEATRLKAFELANKKESNAAAVRKNITMTQESLDLAKEIQVTDFSSLIRAALKHFATLPKHERDALIHAEYIPTRTK